MGLFGKPSDDVQLELIRLIRDVMKSNADLLNSNDRIVRRLEQILKVVTEQSGTVVAAQQAGEGSGSGK